MAEFVRVLRNRNHLHRTDADASLPSGEVKSDAFSSFQTMDGRISLYRLDGRGPNLRRILAAYALTRDKLERVDYVLIDDEFLSQFGATLDPTSRGATPDEGVNSVHEDLEIFTARRLFELVCGLWESVRLGRCETIDLFETVKIGLESNLIDRDRIKKETMIESLRKGLRRAFL